MTIHTRNVFEERPPAVMSVHGNIARVCAWHNPTPTAKKAADGWAKSHNLTVSHGCCDACRLRVMEEFGLTEADMKEAFDAENSL